MTYRSSRPFGLYVHWPYCVSKCPYCDFNSHVAKTVDHNLWAASFVSELERCFKETPDRTVSSIFFGGGTPSLMAPKTTQTIIDTAEKLWGFSPNIEITLEANPTTVETNTFVDFHNAGVNRLSIGVQSLRSNELEFLGRAHNIDDALRALDLASQTFDRYSFDLIYARPNQTLEDWRTELSEALKLSAGHLSLYQLTIEPGTEFFKDKVPSVDEELGAEMYDLTQELMEQAQMPAYEISNHAKAGQESRHNLLYWQGDDYVGIGPGAHSRISTENETFAIHQVYKPDLWLKAVQDKQSAEQKRKSLDTDERIVELLLMGLRIKDGINADHFQALTGRRLTDSVDQEGLARLLDAGFIKWTETNLRPTDEGRKCLDAVLSRLVL